MRFTIIYSIGPEIFRADFSAPDWNAAYDYARNIVDPRAHTLAIVAESPVVKIHRDVNGKVAVAIKPWE